MNRTDYAVIAAAVLTLVDGLMTLPYWALEGNPVVLALGPLGMMAVKLTAVSILLLLWFKWDGVRDSRIAKGCAIGLCGLYALVVGSNLLVLLVSA